MGYIKMELDLNDPDFIRAVIEKFLVDNIFIKVDIKDVKVNGTVEERLVIRIDHIRGERAVKEILLQEGMEEIGNGKHYGTPILPDVMRPAADGPTKNTDQTSDAIILYDDQTPETVEEYSIKGDTEPTADLEEMEEVEEVETERDHAIIVKSEGDIEIPVGGVLPIYASDDHSYNNRGRATLLSVDESGTCVFNTDDKDLASRQYRIANKCLYEIREEVNEEVEVKITITGGEEKPKKKKRTCSICHLPGHWSTTCPNKDKIQDRTTEYTIKPEDECSDPLEEIECEGHTVKPDVEEGDGLLDIIQEVNNKDMNPEPGDFEKAGIEASKAGKDLREKVINGEVKVDNQVVGEVDKEAGFKLSVDKDDVPKGWKRTSSGALMEEIKTPEPKASPDKKEIGSDELIKLIADLSGEKGAMYRDLADYTDEKEYDRMAFDMMLNDLIEEGKIYEPVIGILKVM